MLDFFLYPVGHFFDVVVVVADEMSFGLNCWFLVSRWGVGWSAR